MSSSEPKETKLQLLYTLFCDDVRLEAGNKLSFMGVFQNIMVEQLPVSLIKFAVVNHWRGAGSHETEVRILSPDKADLIVTSQPTHTGSKPSPTPSSSRNSPSSSPTRPTPTPPAPPRRSPRQSTSRAELLD